MFYFILTLQDLSNVVQHNHYTRFSSIVSQPITVNVVVVDADAAAVVIVLVNDFVAIQKLAIKFGQNWVNNS